MGGTIILSNWTARPEIVADCSDRFGIHHPVKSELLRYYACVDRKAQLFVERDFAETKDLSKAFLTLLTAVLVASITFSEKIVDLHRSTWWPRGLMISSWVLLLLAIVTCGTGLALMTIAAGYASYFTHLDYRLFEVKAVWLFGIAGLSFGSGLVALLVAGIVSLVDRSSSQPTTSPAERSAGPKAESM
jgi:hypothetical protein